MKKMRSLLTGVIILCLIAALSVGCTPVDTKPTRSPSTIPSDTKPIVTDPTVTEPPVTEPPATIPPDLPAPTRPAAEPINPPSAETREEALAIATELINRYKLYCLEHICCSFEPVSEDMSQYMTSDQMIIHGDDYHGFQYKITCCHTLEEVRNHIRWTMDDSLIDDGWPDGMLFTDGESLYIPVIATGGFGYSNIRVERRSSSEIIAFADSSSEYEYDYSMAFRILLENGRWYIKDSFIYAIATDDPPYWITP